MEKKDYWQLFMETGAPEMYMLYQEAKRMENAHVSDDPGSGPALDRLQ